MIINALLICLIVFLVGRISKLISENTVGELKGFCIMQVSDIEKLIEDGEWDFYYTVNDSQKSDDGLQMWVVGRRSGCDKYFYSTEAMFEWCYENGWAKPVNEDL